MAKDKKVMKRVGQKRKIAPKSFRFLIEAFSSIRLTPSNTNGLLKVLE